MFKKRLTTNADFLSIIFSGQIEFERFNIEERLPEAANQTEHMLGYQAVQGCAQVNGHHSANDQKQAPLDLGLGWPGDLRNQDDRTIAVMKKK